MTYNFDEVIPRRNTNSLKYDFAAKYGKPEDVLPLWVADMDFKIPPEVTQALLNSASHAIYGYTDTKSDYFRAVSSWFARRFDYAIKEEWLIKTPGIVFALGMAVKAYTSPGDAILIQKPLYYPIENTIVANGRVAIDNPLVYSDGKYTIDMADFEKKIAETNAKVFILCNPHNPVGRCWTREELLEMGRICKKYNCVVVSDEIHCDIVYKGHKHLVFSTVHPDFLDNSIICTAPSKTFNVAGLQVSNIFIASENLRKKFKHEIHATGYSQLNTMGLVACQAAYEQGEAWLEQLMEYLAKNAAFLENFLSEKLPQVKLVKPEGTYLLWLDFSAVLNSLKLTHDEFDSLITNKAGLWLSSGTVFGAAGAGFWRVNIACPRSVLETALLRLENLLVA